MKNIVVWVLMMFIGGRLLACDPNTLARQDSVQIDTLFPREGVVRVYSDFRRDTLLPVKYKVIGEKEKMPLVYLPDSLIRDTLKYEYTKIKDFAYKNKWTKELYKMVFVDPKPGHLSVMRTQNSEQRFKQYTGKIIRDIVVKVLPPYGTSVYDTTYFEEELGE